MVPWFLNLLQPFPNTSSCQRSSQKLYDWLITNKTFGPYLKITEKEGACQEMQVLAVSMIILFAGYAVILQLMN